MYDYTDDLVVQSSDMALSSIHNLYRLGNLDLSPKYQRRNRWNKKRQSQLIESFIANIPVPPVYLAEEKRGKFAVIDGKQRLTAISEFLSDGFELTGLEIYPELSGKKYSELLEYASTLGVRPLRTVTILRQTPELVKHEVFIRLNRGGQPLNAQELRNVAYSGPFNDAIIDASNNSFLHSQLKVVNKSSSAYAQMVDVEMVVRFLALKDKWTEFRGDLRGEMDHFMMQNRNLNNNSVSKQIEAFENSISICQYLWGNRAFQRFDGESWRQQFIGGVFDAQMVAVYTLIKEFSEWKLIDSENASKAIEELFKNDVSFEDSVRSGTNTPSKLKYRIHAVRNLLLDLIEAVS